MVEGDKLIFLEGNLVNMYQIIKKYQDLLVVESKFHCLESRIKKVI